MLCKNIAFIQKGKIRQISKCDLTLLVTLQFLYNFACELRMGVHVCSFLFFCFILWHIIFNYVYLDFYYINTGFHLGFSSILTYFWNISILFMDKFLSLLLYNICSKGDICIITWSQISLSNPTILSEMLTI